MAEAKTCHSWICASTGTLNFISPAYRSVSTLYLSSLHQIHTKFLKLFMHGGCNEQSYLQSVLNQIFFWSNALHYERHFFWLGIILILFLWQHRVKGYSEVLGLDLWPSNTPSQVMPTIAIQKMNKSSHIFSRQIKKEIF